MSTAVHHVFKAELGAPLMEAVEKDDATRVITLLSAGADPNTSLHEPGIKNEDPLTPLMLASHHGNVVIVKALLKWDAKPNTVTKDGETALMMAADFGELSVVKALVAAGARINVRTKDGWTPVMFAVENKEPLDVLQFLIARGANVNARNADGKTALTIAVADAVPLLTQARARH